jgi:hypothetical protein
MSSKFRRLTDLFVQGRTVPLPENAGYLWIQVTNSYERDECVSDAQVARARLILALKDKGEERTKVEARLEEVGFEAMAKDLAQAHAGAKVGDFANEMREDPDWKERMEIMLKTDFAEAATVETEEETLLMSKINAEILAEFNRREQDEIDFLMRRYQRMSEEEFIDEWVEHWLDRRGTAVAGAEYRLTEAWYAARFCEAPYSPDGDIDHSKCGGHRERVFETKADARAAPQLLFELIRSALDDMAMEGRDPKDSDNPENSSGSSPTPNAPAASTPSMSNETPPVPLGT